MSNDSKSFLLEVITPREMFFSGEVDMVVVRTLDGEQGFLKNHEWCVVLLAEDGRLQIRKAGESEKITAYIKGGHIDVKDHTVVYAEEARWK